LIIGGFVLSTDGWRTVSCEGVVAVKTKIFSDRSYLPEGMVHVAMLCPFWGKNPEDPRAPESGRFDRYEEMGRSFFEMTSLEEADLAVMPAWWGLVVHNETARDLSIQFAEKAEEAGKDVVVFYWSDSDEQVPIKNAMVFRTSLYRSRRRPNEFAMPAWSEDYVEKYLHGKLPVRSKRMKPVVGFCGYAPPLKLPLGRRLRNTLRWGVGVLGLREPVRTPFRREKPPNLVRTQALRALLASPRVETNLVVRDRFLGGAWLRDGRTDLALMQKVRLEFLQNMLESDYVLCARGGGNFSYRLYETLSCGRIPVFIDTDCVLPYDFEIDWKKYCVWMDEKEIDSIGDRVAEFHASLTPQDFLTLQGECRRLWNDWLSPVGFFRNFHRHFVRTIDMYKKA